MQSCKECGATWNSNRHVDNCPFCGTNLRTQKTVDRVEEAFSLIIEEHGQSVFLNGKRFLGLLSDYAPKLTNERKLVKIAIEAGAYKALYEASESEKEQTAIRYISILTDSFFVDRKWAKTAIMWCLSVIAPELTKKSNETIQTTKGSIENNSTESTTNKKELSEYTLGEIKTVETIIKELPVAHIETILKKAEGEAKINNNNGYGIVRCRIEPIEDHRLVFETDISDSSIPQIYIPEIEKGIREAAKSGVTTGYSVLGVKVILCGGAYHTVKSTKKAFEQAAKKAFIECIFKADPVLFEAVVQVKTDIPDEKTTNIIDEINERRGCVVRIGFSEKNNHSILEAEVPLTELKIFTRLAEPNSKLSVKFDRYERVPADKIRNVVVLGHHSVGRLTLAEDIYSFAELTCKNLGDIVNGNCASSSIISVEWRDYIINIRSVYDDNEVEEAMKIANGAVIVISSEVGVNSDVIHAWRFCEKYTLPRMFYVSGIASGNSSYQSVTEMLFKLYEKRIVPFKLPYYKNNMLAGVVDVISQKGYEFVGKNVQECKIPEDSKDSLEEYRDNILMSVAEINEKDMERWFSDDEFTEEEICNALKSGVMNGSIVPVDIDVTASYQGVSFLLDDIADFF